MRPPGGHPFVEVGLLGLSFAIASGEDGIDGLAKALPLLAVGISRQQHGDGIVLPVLIQQPGLLDGAVQVGFITQSRGRRQQAVAAFRFGLDMRFDESVQGHHQLMKPRLESALVAGGGWGQPAPVLTEGLALALHLGGIEGFGLQARQPLLGLLQQFGLGLADGVLLGVTLGTGGQNGLIGPVQGAVEAIPFLGLGSTGSLDPLPFLAEFRHNLGDVVQAGFPTREGFRLGDQFLPRLRAAPTGPIAQLGQAPLECLIAVGEFAGQAGFAQAMFQFACLGQCLLGFAGIQRLVELVQPFANRLEVGLGATGLGFGALRRRGPPHAPGLPLGLQFGADRGLLRFGQLLPSRDLLRPHRLVAQ